MTVVIFHISDTHGESNTLPSLDNLAREETQADVVALTGDVVSNWTSTVPIEWDKWPQNMKLSVPGNHDVGCEPFSKLQQWIHDPPYAQCKRDLLFVGFGTDDGAERLDYLRNAVEKWTAIKTIRGVVVLCHHRWREVEEDGPALETMATCLGKRPVLLLHGDEHNRSVLPDGHEWSQWVCRTRKCDVYRSNIYSAWKNTGLAHKIRWSWDKFSCKLLHGTVGD